MVLDHKSTENEDFALRASYVLNTNTSLLTAFSVGRLRTTIPFTSPMVEVSELDSWRSKLLHEFDRQLVSTLALQLLDFVNLFRIWADGVEQWF